jgi:hypothetical protein
VTIQIAVTDILHAKPLEEVLRTLLEATCPVCGDPNYYVGIKGKDCPNKGCVHYSRALDPKKYWQPLVRDSLAKPKDKALRLKALEAMEKAGVSVHVMANSGLDPISVLVFKRQRTYYDKIHNYVDQVMKQVKKNFTLKRVIKDGLVNTRTPSYLTYQKQWEVDPSPNINNPHVEKWFKGLKDKPILTLELGQNYGLNFEVETSRYNKIDYYEIISTSKTVSDVDNFARLVGDKIRRHYNHNLSTSTASKKIATHKKAIKGTLIHGRWQNWLDAGDLVPGWGIPPVQGVRGMGNIDATTVYEIVVHKAGTAKSNRWTEMIDLKNNTTLIVLVDETDLWEVYVGKPPLHVILRP